VCGEDGHSYRLAGEASDLFAAVGIVAGTVGFRLPNGLVTTIPKPDRPASAALAPAADISATELIWAFFAAHPRGAVSRTS
jgi:poly(3-hydroxybutyrate) depolymerase